MCNSSKRALVNDMSCERMLGEQGIEAELLSFVLRQSAVSKFRHAANFFSFMYRPTGIKKRLVSVIAALVKQSLPSIRGWGARSRIGHRILERSSEPP